MTICKKTNKKGFMKKPISIILIFSMILIFTSCSIIDGGYGSLVNHREQFDSFKKLELFINENNVTKDTYVLFDFDDSSIAKTTYSVFEIVKLRKEIKHNIDSAKIIGRFEINDNSNDLQVEISYCFTNKNRDENVNKEATFEINQLSMDEARDNLVFIFDTPTYENSYSYGLYADNILIAHIVMSSTQILDEEKLSDFSLMMLEHIKIK